jgi:alkanesulfonate monooxygenase SsuD/methylene tetrahydromethanopterin reductase-like flavin-dependent oxidoreductase (luciferase family)
MKVGIVPREWGNFILEAVEQVELTQKLGFDSVWVEEHHGNKDYLPSPLIAAAALSQHVSEMRVGSAIAILPIYNPVRFASDVSVLDCITNGRFVVGVGVGYRERDFQSFNVSMDERGARMDEGLEIVDRLLRGEKLSFAGVYFKLKDFQLQPKPIQKPRPPIWVGGWRKKSLERAALMGDRWFAGPVATFSFVENAKRVYLSALKRAGKRFVGYALMRDAYISTDSSRIDKELKKSVVHMYDEDYSKSGHPLLDVSRSSHEWIEDRFILGTPAQCVELISDLKKKGVEHLVLRVSLRGLTHKRIMDSIRLFGEKVLPSIRD